MVYIFHSPKGIKGGFEATFNHGKIYPFLHAGYPNFFIDFTAKGIGSNSSYRKLGGLWGFLIAHKTAKS
jgi:hypothetical protein